MTPRLLAAVWLVLVAPVIALMAIPACTTHRLSCCTMAGSTPTGRATVYPSLSLMTDGRGAAPAR